MRGSSLSLTFVLGVLLLGGTSFGAAPATAPSTGFKAGFAERDITPEVGMEQPGGYVKAFHRTFHDPCKVRASVFDDGKTRVAVVGIDALLIRRQTVAPIRAAIHEKTGIAPEAILIAASHDHSAGPIGMILPGEFDHASPLVQELAYKKSSCANAGYLARVQQAVMDAVVEADSKRTDCRCAVGKGREETVSFNRRLRMKNGLSFSHPGVGNPDIVGPAGPIDPDVVVLGAWDPKTGNLTGCVVNFACHATTGPGGISADYIYYLERAIRGVTGQQNANVVFVNGACGDITQVDNQSRSGSRQSGEAAALKVGGRVGAEAARVLLSVSDSAGSLAPVAYKDRILSIKRRAPSPEHLARAMEIVSHKQPPAGTAFVEWTFAKETVLLDARIKEEPVAPVEVQAIQVGPLVILANPAEYFCQYGLDIKAAGKFPFTMISELTNDNVGYVPTEEAFGPHGGGYETRLTSHSNLEITAGRQIADALIDMASKFTPGPVPQPPPVKEAAKPWAYGSLPPQRD